MAIQTTQSMTCSEMLHPMLAIYRFRGFDNPSAVLFQQYLSEKTCPACGAKVTEKSPGNVVIWVGSAGTKWTDVLSNIDGLLLSDRVVDVITAEGLTGFRAHPVTIEKIESKKLTIKQPPKYYFVELIGRFDIDPDEIDDEGGSICSVCFYRNAKDSNPYRWSPKRIVPRLDTCDGGDLCKTNNLRNAHKYCSKRFIDLACKHQWTNFIFGESLPGIGLWEKPPKGGLSYWDPDWFAKLSERVKAKHADLFP